MRRFSRHTGATMKDLEDKQLVKLACDGDARAFELLLERHYDRIFRMTFKWCRNRSDAEDITQDVCIKLARAIRGYNGKAAFTTWLYRIVINTAIDWRRSNKRADTETLDPEAGHIGAIAPVAETNLIANDDLARVMALPDKEKTALLLVLGEGLSHSEAALIMEVKESTVSWYIYEARKKLGVISDKKTKGAPHG
jgi:RNA polymerase sigma-70 factor (ECF subfamily)